MSVMDEMDVVFAKAKAKAISKIHSPGNTIAPWNDFSIGHLEARLTREYNEWFNDGSANKLLDIINMAVFIYLARQKRGVL